MSDIVLPTNEALLKLCAAAAPKPWYPKEYAQTSGVPRDSLDEPLNELRLNGLIRLTEWVQGLGQGYVLTEFGEEVLEKPAHLAELRAPKPAALSDRGDEASHPGNDTELSALERGDKVRAAFFEPEPPVVMPILLLINLLAFGASFAVALRAGVPGGQFLVQGNVDVLHQVGALTPVDLVRGEWWRLLTCCFLHFGLIHLVMNMWSLYVLGLLESLWGAPRFILLYLLSGIGGSCAAMLFSPSGELAGASGALCGLLASLGAWVFMNRSHLPPQEAARFVPRFGVALLMIVGVSFLPGVSGAGHFGGGLVGFVLATLLHVQRFAQPPRRTAATILILLLPMLCIAAVHEAMQKDERWLQIKMKENQIQRNMEIAQFKQDAETAVDKAEGALHGLRDQAFILTDKAPADRNAEQIQKIKDQLQAARALDKLALEKLGSNPSDDDRVNAAQSAGKEYVQEMDRLIGTFDELLERKTSWEKDARITAEAKVKKAQARWVEARNAL